MLHLSTEALRDIGLLDEVVVTKEGLLVYPNTTLALPWPG